jgi:(5-formylfuran-3-yl)methyl phosphate synthase
MRLMISVVSASEALEAQAGGAALLDVKNPHEGSLGAQFPKVVREIKQVAEGNTELSVAIGDMPNLPGTAAMAALGAATCGIDYIKVGLYGMRTDADSIRLLRAVKDAITGFKTRVIAAAYADHHRIESLAPSRLPQVAGEAGVDGCLIDTAIKDGSTLLDYLTAEDLTGLAKEAHARNLLFGAAGALSKHHLPLLREAKVDVAGLRTAVCSNNVRTGTLDAGRVRDLIRLCDALEGSKNP